MHLMTFSSIWTSYKLYLLLFSKHSAPHLICIGSPQERGCDGLQSKGEGCEAGQGYEINPPAHD